MDRRPGAGAMMSTILNRVFRCVGFAWAAIVVTCAIGVSLVLAPATGATEDKRLEVTHFTLQTIASTRTEGECKHTPTHGGACRYVNEPYAFTQAGGHPWGLTTTVQFATEEFKSPEGLQFSVPTRDPKDIVADLPPGLLGDPQAVPRCPLLLILDRGLRCPSETQVGWARLRLFGGKEFAGPIVNLTPEAGQSAEFGLENESGFTFVLTAHLVRTIEGVKRGYGVAVATNGIPIVELSEAELTFWGVPADPSHDLQRGLFCIKAVKAEEKPFYLACYGGGESSGVPPLPFLIWPTDCSAGPETATMRADSWEEPGAVGLNQQYEGYVEAQATLPGVTGCNALQFNAGTGLAVHPERVGADEPVGLGVKLDVPLNEGPGEDATPQLRDTTVTLPEGMSVSPGVVDGIQACNESGPEGINIEGPESERAGLNGELQLAPGHCPAASTVGTAEAITPLLPVPVKGHVFLARPGCGGQGQSPCTELDALDGNLYKLYLELGGEGQDANTGIEFKVPFNVEANPATGQLTTVVKGIVQAPVSEVKIDLNGGPRASVDNPAVCGPAVTTSDFTPWSAPGTTPEGLLMAGTPDALSSSYYLVQGCSNPPPFTPVVVAGTVTPNAAKFSSFTLNLSRQDREQYVKGIQVHTPPGLLAMLSSVPLCPEAQANDPSVHGECPSSSKIGTTRVASGAGSHPFEIEGQVYLTGPYRGAPFGLSVVTRAVAGPFNLGLVVVRARINIDPETSTARITTDETGPYAIPQIIFGVPLRLRRVTVDIDRPGFMFNPTNCAQQQIEAVVSGSQETIATLNSPFAVGGCQSLAFKPNFTVSTSGHTSRRNGASLDVKLSYPKGAMGHDANIARVKVDLPRQLPSRLTTLQKACPAATFAANPATCPPASVVGIAKTTTPVLPVQLEGPVYFVSHGGEAFPNLIVVLQGDGVRVDLVGDTFISKAGITSSTFKSVPDVPVNTFELYLPQGRYSALAATGSLCKSASKLKMPTEFVAQNGAVVKQSTKVSVSGCTTSKARSARHKAKPSGKRRTSK